MTRVDYKQYLAPPSWTHELPFNAIGFSRITVETIFLKTQMTRVDHAFEYQGMQFWYVNSTDMMCVLIKLKLRNV